MFTTKQKPVFPFHMMGKKVSVVCFLLFTYYMKNELFSKYEVLSDVMPHVICLIYAPPNLQPVD